MGGYSKHGDSRIRLYRTWQSMRYRCQNARHTAYSKYGAIAFHEAMQDMGAVF